MLGEWSTKRNEGHPVGIEDKLNVFYHITVITFRITQKA